MAAIQHVSLPSFVFIYQDEKTNFLSSREKNFSLFSFVFIYQDEKTNFLSLREKNLRFSMFHCLPLFLYIKTKRLIFFLQERKTFHCFPLFLYIKTKRLIFFLQERNTSLLILLNLFQVVIPNPLIIYIPKWNSANIIYICRVRIEIKWTWL